VTSRPVGHCAAAGEGAEDDDLSSFARTMMLAGTSDACVSLDKDGGEFLVNEYQLLALNKAWLVTLIAVALFLHRLGFVGSEYV
jgi:hypothetical protein